MTAREKHPGPDCEEHCIYCAAERARNNTPRTRASGPIPTPQSLRAEQREAEAAQLGLVPGIVAIPTPRDTLTEIARLVATLAPGYSTLTLFGADAVAMVRALPEAEHGEHVMATEPSRLIRAHLTVADLRVTAQATEPIETCDACGRAVGEGAERTGDAEARAPVRLVPHAGEARSGRPARRGDGRHAQRARRGHRARERPMKIIELVTLLLKADPTGQARVVVSPVSVGQSSERPWYVATSVCLIQEDGHQDMAAVRLDPEQPL